VIEERRRCRVPDEIMQDQRARLRGDLTAALDIPGSTIMG
jgi:hypothetical protein